MTEQQSLRRDLIFLPRGGKDWRACYSRYRRTTHWKTTRAFKLKLHPFCEVCMLMTATHTTPATEVHHRTTNFFHEAAVNDLVSCCKSCHLMWKMRRLRRNRR